MTLDRYEIHPETSKFYEDINFVLSMVFLAEMIIKLYGLGFFEYVSDPLNIFDAVIVTLSVVEIVLVSLLKGKADMGPITVFRTFRLLRLFKLARR